MCGHRNLARADVEDGNQGGEGLAIALMVALFFWLPLYLMASAWWNGRI